MAPRNKSYAQSMEDWKEEKRFLRKVRHKAFHPNVDSPLLSRLVGYLVRLVILLAVVGSILFIRNRSYFSGPAFTAALQEEADHFLGAKESEMGHPIWKNNIFQTSYEATGGPHAFFKQIDARRVGAKGSWRDMLLNENWKLEDTEVGELKVTLKSGASSSSIENNDSSSYVRDSSLLSATPDFANTRFGNIDLHSMDFSWGPFWTSKGSLTKASGILKKSFGGWELLVKEGILGQNWLRGLTVDPAKPLKVLYKDGKISLSEGEFTLGEAGRATLSGTITIAEAPLFDLQLEMKTIELEDLLPEEFHQTITGIADFSIHITGSTNRSDGIIFGGEMTIVQSARIRDIPVFLPLSVYSTYSQLRHLPIRSGSQIAFTTRKGVLKINDMNLVSGEDVAKLRGSFAYHIDTSELDNLSLGRLPGALDDDEPVLEEPLIGFDGEVEFGVKWDALGRDLEFRDRHFTEEGPMGWIKIPLKESLALITAPQAEALGHQLGVIDRRRKGPFERTMPRGDSNN